MKRIKDNAFEVVDHRAMMTFEAVADLLNMTEEELERVVKKVESEKTEHGIWRHNNKFYFSNSYSIRLVRDSKGYQSADISTSILNEAFANANKTLLTREEQENLSPTYKFETMHPLKQWSIILAFFLVIGSVIYGLIYMDSENESQQTKSNTVVSKEKIEEKAPTQEPAQLSTPPPAPVQPSQSNENPVQRNIKLAISEALSNEGNKLDIFTIEQGVVKFAFEGSDNLTWSLMKSGMIKTAAKGIKAAFDANTAVNAVIAIVYIPNSKTPAMICGVTRDRVNLIHWDWMAEDLAREFNEVKLIPQLQNVDW